MSLLAVSLIVIISFFVSSILYANSYDLPINQLPNTNKIELQTSDILHACDRDDECVIVYLQSLSKTISNEKMLSFSNEIVTAWEKDDFNCHEAAHHVGEFLLGYFDRDILKAISYVDSKCGNGLYHGLIENFLPLQVILDDKKIEELDVTKICEDLGSSSNSYIGLVCAHGMGHGLAKVYNFDVFDAVKRCDEFSTMSEQVKCQRGLFMENRVEHFNTGKGTFDEFDILYPCNLVEKKYQKTCFGVHGGYILKQLNFSPTSAFQECEKISNEDFIKSCYAGVGLHMADYYFFDIEKTSQMCENTNKKYQRNCISGSIFSIIRYIEPESGLDFCNLLSDNLSEYCINKWLMIRDRHM